MNWSSYGDLLDRSVKFLQKRDGIDKTLKICRYAARLVLAAQLLDKKGETVVKLKSFESSLGTSRKAYRLGKFLQDVNALRRTSPRSLEGLLEFVAYGGEGVYYFVEQFVWLVKAGALDKRHSQRLVKVSAWAEFIGYIGSVTLKLIKLNEETVRLCEISHVLGNTTTETSLVKGKQREAVSDPSTSSDFFRHLPRGGALEYSQNAIIYRLQNEYKSLLAKRFMRFLSLVQDLADAMLALDDIRGVKGKLSNPFLLSVAGMLSALISAHKNWIAT